MWIKECVQVHQASEVIRQCADVAVCEAAHSRKQSTGPALRNLTVKTMPTKPGGIANELKLAGEATQWLRVKQMYTSCHVEATYPAKNMILHTIVK